MNALAYLVTIFTLFHLKKLFLFQHTLIVASPLNLIDAPMIVGERGKSPYLFRGIG